MSVPSWEEVAQLVGAGRLDEAASALERTLALDGQDLRSLWALGVVQAQRGRHEEALACLDRALALQPADAQLWYDRGKVLHGAGRLQEALTSVEQALARRADYADAWLNRANILRDLGPANDEQALAAYTRAAQLQPGNARAWAGLARTQWARRQFDPAVASMRRAVALDPSALGFVVELIRLQQEQALWATLPPLWARALARVDEQTGVDAPFTMLSHPTASAADLLRGARALARAARTELPAAQPAAARPTAMPAPAGRRLRIGYLSADLRAHSVGHLMVGVFEAHDRARFEIVGLDIYPEPQPDTPFRRRIVAALDQLELLGELSAADIAERVRALELDVLIDLQGASGHTKPGVVLRRPAPVQVNYLGFPGTSGMEEIDYLLGDRWVCPPGHEAEFSEQVVRLPEVFQANDRQRPIVEETPTRASLGLPEQGFVFCCLNNTYKILPSRFDIWMRLLTRVPGSVLWLLGENEVVRRELRQQARQRGVAPDRLVFATRVAYPQYLAQYRQADLFLDTLPFGSGTTASDALWAGLPVLTQIGDRFAGRMAASLLHAIGLPELVTRSDEAYESLALQLATEPERLRGLRQRLAANRLASPLFDTERFTRHLEQALEMMVERRARGLPPAAFDVPALPP